MTPVPYVACKGSSAPKRPRVFVVLEYFVPGFKAGGPLRSIWNLTVALREQFDFYVYTRDRDEGDDEPFADVLRDSWQDIGNAKVFYASPSRLSMASLARAIKTVGPHVIYLNSAFSPMSLRVLVLRKLGVAPAPTIVAPRNELSPGALSLKRTKKRAFVAIAHMARLYKRAIWQCSNDAEAAQVRAVFADARTEIACDVAMPLSAVQARTTPSKRPGSANFVYVSRISPKKNLLMALQALQACGGDVTFDIYGPIQDAGYWRDCLDVIRSMPSNVTATYRGSLRPESIQETLAPYHYFVLPTLGENFGHAIHEALSVGLPVLIGTETPWSTVTSTKAGWVVQPDVPSWTSAITEAVMTTSDELRLMGANAWEVAISSGVANDAVQANRRLLSAAVAMCDANVEL